MEQQRQPSITINFDWFLKLFLFFIPIIWLPNFTQANLQMLFFNYGALLLFALSICLPVKREFKNYNISLLLLICVMTSLIINPRALSIYVLNIIFGCLLYYCIVRNTEDIKGILKIFPYLALLNIAILILQLLKVNILYMPINHPLAELHLTNCGLMGRDYHLAFFLAIISPILAGYSFLFILLIGLVLLILKSYIAIFAFVCGITLFYFLKAKQKKWFLSIPVVIFISLFCLFLKHPNKLFVRFPAWEFLLKESFINPFVGRGLGTFDIILNMPVLGASFLSGYSQYFLALFEIGIIPVCLLVYFSFKYYKRLFQCSQNNETASMLFSSLVIVSIIFIFHEILRFPRLAIPIVAILALFEAVCIDNLKKEVLLCQ